MMNTHREGWLGDDYVRIYGLSAGLTRLLLTLFLAGASMALANDSDSEGLEKLGFGFQRVLRSEPVHVSSEGIGHFAYLYYRNQKLCQLGTCAISPSGRFAIYQDGPSGNFFLFRRADRKTTQLTRQFIALARSFDWQEESGTVTAKFEGQRLRIFPLQ